VSNLKVEGPYVWVHEVSIVDKTYFEKLKEMETKKAKSYAAVVHSNTVLTQDDCDKLNAVRNMPVNQQTPIRVLHRRS
jgi:tRNA U54 and U55 pseudouridine synthase Pus10